MRKAAPDSGKSREVLEQQVRTGQFAPLYLLEGPEKWLRERALHQIQAAAIDPSLGDFNASQISVAGGNLEEALRLARQYPLMAARRLVVVRDFESLSEEGPIEALKNYLGSPAETTILVFTTPGLDNRRTIASLLKKGCQVVSFPLLDDSQAVQWARGYVEEAGCRLDPAVAGRLIGRVGVELGRLVPELEKLLCYLGGSQEERSRTRPAITAEVLDLLVRDSREHSNFELTDAILAGDRGRALRLLDRIYTNGSDSPQSISLMMLGAIASNYRRLAMAKDLMAQSLPNSEVAQALGMSPYAVTHVNEKARRLDWSVLQKGIERLAQTDLALKSSLGTPRLQMELLICELTAKETPTRPLGQAGTNRPSR